MAAERPVSAAVRVRRLRAARYLRPRRPGRAFTASLSQKGRGSPGAADPRAREPPQARQRRPGRLCLLGLRAPDCSGPWRDMTLFARFRRAAPPPFRRRGGAMGRRGPAGGADWADWAG